MKTTYVALLLAQRLTAARQGYSLSRVFRSLTTSTCRKQTHAYKTAYSNTRRKKKQRSIDCLPICNDEDFMFLTTFTGLSLKRAWVYSATRGAAIRSGSEPPMSRHATLKRGEKRVDEERLSDKTSPWRNYPPATLQSISELHQPPSLCLICSPQPQDTHLAVSGFHIHLPNFKRLLENTEYKK